MVEPEVNEKIPYAVWPDNAPHESETLIVTIVACESQYRWAIHEGVNEDFFPIVFWRTSTISAEEIEESVSPTALLHRYFPDQAKEIVYGGSDAVRSTSTAAAYRATQRIPAVSVYCILPAESRRRDPNLPSAADVAERALVYMLQGSFPCNLYKLQASDFWASERSRSTEQLATVAAVDFLYPSRHCLLIDGGMTLTLTAVAAAACDRSEAENGLSSKDDCANAAAAATAAAALKDDAAANLASPDGVVSSPDRGAPDEEAASTRDDRVSNGAPGEMRSTHSTSIRIVGDFRTVSITSKLHVMHQQTGALPEVTAKQVQDTLLELEEKSYHLPMFATKTFDAMIGTIVHETTLLVQTALKTWALSSMIQPGALPNGSGKTYPLVCITGMESDIIAKLLTNGAFELAADPDLIWLPNQTDTTEESKLLQIRRPPGVEGEDVVVEVKTHRHLAFNGIRSILAKHCKARKDSMTEPEKLRQEILGCRVAKDFGKEQGGVYFGQVMSVDRLDKASVDEDLYMVRFDDGDSEEVGVTELYEHLVSYCEKVGQYSSAEFKIKREDSDRVARTLALTSVAVQQELERKNKNSLSSLTVSIRNNGGPGPAPIETGASVKEEVAAAANSQSAPAVASCRVKSALKRPYAEMDASDEASPSANNVIDPKSFLKRRIAKYFGKKIYFGTIVEYEEPKKPGDPPIWHGLYDDDDKERYFEDEVEQLLELYARPGICRKDKNPNGLAR